MANQKHLMLLARGVTTWNEWRRDSEDAIPDLSGSDLTKFRTTALRGVNFDDANLQATNLAGLDLTRASFYEAKLGGASLRGSHLYGACFMFADLTEADLEGSHLGTAELSDADFTCANLRYANLTGVNAHANFTHTVLEGANLTGADFQQAADLTQYQIDTALAGKPNLRKQLPKDKNGIQLVWPN